MRFGLGPDHEHIGNRAVRDPHLGAIDDVATVGFLGDGLHSRRVGPGIGFGQTKAPDQRACSQTRQVFLALLVASIGVDRIHHEGALYAHHRPIPAVDAFDFAGDKTIAHIARTQTAELFGDGHTQQTHLAHLGENLGCDTFVQIHVRHARQQLVFCIRRSAVRDHALFLGQSRAQTQRVLPVEFGE